MKESRWLRCVSLATQPVTHMTWQYVTSFTELTSVTATNRYADCAEPAAGDPAAPEGLPNLVSSTATFRRFLDPDLSGPLGAEGLEADELEGAAGAGVDGAAVAPDTENAAQYANGLSQFFELGTKSAWILRLLHQMSNPSPVWASLATEKVDLVVAWGVSSDDIADVRELALNLSDYI